MGEDTSCAIIVGADGFPVSTDTPYRQQQLTVNEVVLEVVKTGKALKDSWWSDSKTASALARAEPETMGPYVFALLERVLWLGQDRADSTRWTWGEILGSLAMKLMRRRAFQEADIPHLLDVTLRVAELDFDRLMIHHFPSLSLRVFVLLDAFGFSAERAPSKPEWPLISEKLRRLRRSALGLSSCYGASDMKNALLRLLGPEPPGTLEPIEEWAIHAEAVIENKPPKARNAWRALLAHAASAASSKPSGKWLRRAAQLIEDLGTQEFKEAVLDWFPRVRKVALLRCSTFFNVPPLCDGNTDILRGLVWCCRLVQDRALTLAVDQLAEKCFKKVPGWGPLSMKVGNACLFTLESLPDMLPVAHLSRLKLKVTQANAQKLIQRALEEAARRLGISSAELEELAAPTCGLEEGGVLRETFGEWTAEVRVTGTQTTELVWFKGNSSSQKTAPAVVKQQHADGLKELKRVTRDIEVLLPAQRDRIERMFRESREWHLQQWRERYLDHPLVGLLARRLIWQFTLGEHDALGIWRQGELVNAEDKRLDWLAPETRVRLWHPISSTVADVSAWRRWLEAHEIKQPFKQAHREVYPLTDAERETSTYSNRFAAHLIKQHQFAALAKQRGWKYTLQIRHDSSSTPTLPLPQWNCLAEFWVEPTGELAGSTVALYLSTDQVRFVRDGQPLALSDVPTQVFTEVMRDVDLFVGVCSIGNDPAWQDRGEIQNGGAYWHSYSFGDLSATAKIRREVLERLLPKLKITPQCALQEKFLVVTGSLRTYKIHLGSGNILMEPNDQYLCIVPDRGRTAAKQGEVFLPFEGDNTLSVILSKAFLLAEDSKISDQTILRQIRTR